MGSFYKIISKLLAERLKKVMNAIVAKSPMAFIKKRQITDAVSMANEYFDSRRRQGKIGLFFKLDIALLGTQRN